MAYIIRRFTEVHSKEWNSWDRLDICKLYAVRSRAHPCNCHLFYRRNCVELRCCSIMSRVCVLYTDFSKARAITGVMFIPLQSVLSCGLIDFWKGIHVGTFHNVGQVFMLRRSPLPGASILL